MPAVTSVTNFSDGNVLTASALNAVNCGIHVYADAAARDAAYGGSGERTLVEGEYAYLLDTNQTLVYSGSSWVSVATAPGLVLITTATATAVQTLSINDCFSSTYAAYEIQIINTDSVGVNSAFTARMRVSGTDTTTQYKTQRLFAYSTTTGAGANTAGTDEWYIGDLDPTNKGYFTKITLHNPNVATKTTGRVSGNNIDSSGAFVLNEVAVVQDATTQFTGITFITVGTSFTGTIRVYGYANS
jgi:hypothetical protein